MWNLFLLLLTINLCSGQQQFFLPAPSSSVAVNSNSGEVFVAVIDVVWRLDRHLEVVEPEYHVGGELLKIVLSPDGGRLLGCVAEGACLTFDSSSLESGHSVLSDVQYISENNLAVIAVNHSFYLGSEGPVGADRRIQLSQYQYTDESVRTSEYLSDSDMFTGFSFYGGFTRNGYTYYFVSDVARGEARVLRVCDCASDTCSSSSFEALYLLTLQCSDVLYHSQLCGVTLLETFADQDEPVVVVTHCGANGNRVCGYLLSEIDSSMDAFYEQCRHNTSLSFQLPWKQEATSCSSFAVSLALLM